MPSPFMGEVMTCRLCGRKWKSDPKVESDWTLVQFDNHRLYFCPQCFGNDLRWWQDKQPYSPEGKRK